MTRRLNVSESGHWRFVVDLYNRPGVSDACLGLQDVFGVDVVLLLMLVSAASEGLSITDADVADADATVRSWRTDVVIPLRHIRRTLKVRAGPESTLELRESVKALELRAERIELAELAAWLSARTGPPSLVADVGGTVRLVVHYYVGRRALTGDEANLVNEASSAIEQGVLAMNSATP